jgi:hypothetical protein
MMHQQQITKHTARHLTVILEASSPDYSFSLYHPHQDIPCRLTPCRSNTQSHTKPSTRLQTSFTTMAMTGMNSVQARTLLEPSRRPPRRKNAKGANETKKCRNEWTSCSRTAPPDKPKSFRPLPHSFTTTTFGKCINRPKLHSGLPRRLT